MRFIRGFFSKAGIFGELLSFMWHRKLWWLIPLVIILVLIGVLIVVTGTIGPYIYPLF